MEETTEALTPEALSELESLRAEKRQRALTEHAKSTLSARGISNEFAPFLLGADESATLRNIAAFEKSYQSALSAEISRRLPRQQPQDLSVAPARSRRGGIRKV